MCQAPSEIVSSATRTNKERNNDSTTFSSSSSSSLSLATIISKFFRSIYPLPPLVAFALLPLVVPTDCYLNRGFTQWFFWASVFYGLTRWKFLVKFQILLGTSVCLGWYCSLCYDYYQHGRFFDILYKNMPQIMTNQMFIFNDNDTDNYSTTIRDATLDFQSTRSLLTMLLANVLDTLMHPLQTYYFWWLYQKQQQNHNTNGGGGDGKLKPSSSCSDILTWPVIVSSYMYSRLWSVTHTYYNFGTPGPFYVGHDVYVLDSLDAWYPAYIAESTVYATVVLWKLFVERKKEDENNSNNNNSNNTDGIFSVGGGNEEGEGVSDDIVATTTEPITTTTTTTTRGQRGEDSKPNLVYSESGVSIVE
jgi:hypothetical protein